MINDNEKEKQSNDKNNAVFFIFAFIIAALLF